MKDKIILTSREERLSSISKALGHPTRLIILLFLTRQESCYFGDIHNELPIVEATVSQHLKELKDSGLIQGEISPKVKCCINRENWFLAKEYFSELFLELKENKECCE